jgi:hypothetical protein
MEPQKIIYGNSAAEVEQRLEAELAGDESLLQYNALIEQQGRRIVLDIDIDPGGGFEGGYAFTRLSAPLSTNDNFKFHIHDEGFLADVGKLFGMQDVVIGFPEFDDKVIVKTNNKDRVKSIFADTTVREVFSSLPDFHLQVKEEELDDNQQSFLELEIEEGITEPHRLCNIYKAFYTVLVALDTMPANT